MFSPCTCVQPTEVSALAVEAQTPPSYFSNGECMQANGSSHESEHAQPLQEILLDVHGYQACPSKKSMQGPHPLS